ncbi:ATP-utilizing chromatin assembly and remodelling N-terminal-domain-containing protein [Zychaea mexicana]|uniref:ATP-utilizing chromatin assembly and remodelling N-terminal-domain-containing protein n=1 Tax=Zychaea mexicana TaxID=64656 RepID=UPI0022FED837|nr:ATP-utilizing chromatin assembly and remodelling N-terminal-domain-containing protein [Zychaea mexicana]KAI9479531.1 ATP-utilizing chromatin assembly and remodelling N-terminal-domain-containing protein [Zychaea mexicana]
MPLLKRKTFPLLPPPPFDPERKDSRDRQVWVSSITSEIFTDYQSYLKRYTLYKAHVWQCEVSGRSNLTYEEALESERTEKNRVKEKLPDALQKRVLERAQFQCGRLDAVVDDVHEYYINRFDSGDMVTCRWNDGVKYIARVLRVVSDNVHPISKSSTLATNSGTKVNGKEIIDENSTSNATTNGNASGVNFLVELVDDDLSGVDDFRTVVNQDDLKRDRLAFSKNLLKKFLRENLVKESYNHAPWVVKAQTAAKFGIDTTLPKDLQAVKDQIDAKSRKRKTPASDFTNGELDGAEADASGKTSTKTKAKSSVSTAKARGKSEMKKTVDDAKKIESSIKYPIEDLDVPIYRRKPSGEGPILDMKPGQPKAKETIPNPTGGMPLCPTPSQHQTVPSDALGSLLMVWSFISVFARSLGLYPFPLDDFESALLHTSPVDKSQILIESNVCLLNTIIKERKKSKNVSLLTAPGTLTPTSSSLRGTPTPSPSRQPSVLTSEDEHQAGDSTFEDQDGSASTSAIINPTDTENESVWTSPQIYEIGRAWDAKLIPVGNDRKGWEDVMIGCINDITTPDQASNVDRIFSYLVPREDTTLEEREEAYLRLSLKDKVFMFEMLVGLVNECSFIKEFMEECQEQMTELRKQKIDLSRERKRIHAERQEFEKRIDVEEKANNPDADEDESSDDSDDDEENIDRSSSQADTSTPSPSRTESRQALLKRKQIEREEREAKRLKMYHQQREEARARNQELKARNAARKKLDDEERHVYKKEEQLEHNMRKYSTLRIKPLGRDKFFNRYMYLDNIGGAHVHGTGRLFVQSPSDLDLTIIRERNDPLSFTQTIPVTTNTSNANNNSTTPSCGHGGGIQFVSALMQAQGFAKEADFMEQRIRSMDGMANNAAATTLQTEEWWRSYDDPEDIDKLLAWLNPKGEREHRLIRELNKHAHNLANGMKKRMTDQSNASKPEVSRRSTRSKGSSTGIAPGSWLAYVNKFAK